MTSKWARVFSDLCGVISGEITEEQAGMRRVALTKSSDNAGIGVSTAWMPDEECYETAVYDSTDFGRVYVVEHYATEAEALDGHAKWLEKAKPGATIKRIDRHPASDVILDPSRPEPPPTVEVSCPKCGTSHHVMRAMSEIETRCSRCLMDNIMGRS